MMYTLLFPKVDSGLRTPTQMIADADSRAILSQERQILPVEPDDEIESCLAKPWYLISFSKRLERKYQTYISSTHRSQLRFALLLLAAVHLLLLSWRDSELQPQIRMASILVEAGVVLPLSLFGFLYLRRDRSVLQQSFAALTPAVIAGVNTLWIGAHLSSQLADRTFMGLAMAIFICNALMPVPLEAVAAVTTFLLGLYDAVLAGYIVPSAAPQSVETAVMMNFFVLVSIGIRWRYEADDRHGFLLAARDRIHTQMLAWANRQLTELSYTDPLTKLPNRRYFDEALGRAWDAAREAGQGIGVLMIDVDHFKRFNDTLGHGEGDQCLRRVAQAIQFNVRVETDTVARYGGEEFVAILPKASREDSLNVAERIRAAVEKLQIRNTPAAGGPGVTVSVGVACCDDPRSFDSADVLLHAADLALYAAKNEGRNRVVSRTELPVAPPWQSNGAGGADEVLSQA